MTLLSLMLVSLLVAAEAAHARAPLRGPTDVESPATILDRVAKGEPGAAERCVERYADLVWSVARRLCPRSDAEDAVQEIFIDLWKSAARFDASLASEPAFVVMIARRRLIDRLRRSARRPAPAQLAEGSDAPQPGARSAEAALGAAEEASIALRELEALAPEQRRCITLAVQQGYTHTQIAEATGLPLGTVKTHVRRGLIRIREGIENKAKRPATAGRRP